MDLHDFVPTYKIFLWEAKDEKKRSGSIFHFNTHFSFFLSFNWFFSYTRKIDHSHLPDLIVDKFELTPKYAILGEPYKINIRFKEYPRLTKSPWIEVVRENTFAPALLRSTRKFSIPPQWKSSSPEITINYDAEQLIDIAVQHNRKK
jgi:hypothetical protein